jgi:hypothetical protein
MGKHQINLPSRAAPNDELRVAEFAQGTPRFRRAAKTNLFLTVEIPAITINSVSTFSAAGSAHPPS